MEEHQFGSQALHPSVHFSHPLQMVTPQRTTWFLWLWCHCSGTQPPQAAATILLLAWNVHVCQVLVTMVWGCSGFRLMRTSAAAASLADLDTYSWKLFVDFSRVQLVRSNQHRLMHHLSLHHTPFLQHKYRTSYVLTIPMLGKYQLLLMTEVSCWLAV